MYLFNVKCSIKEAEKPQGNLVARADLRVVAGVDDVGRDALAAGLLRVDDAELQLLVDEVVVVSAPGVHLVVFPKRVDEEGLHRLLLLHLDGVDGVHEVGVVEHDLRGLLGEVLADGIDEVCQAGVGQVLDVVHDGGTAGLDVVGELAHVGCLRRTVLGNHVEELLNLREVFELDLLDEQDVYLSHHVHRLQQVLAIVALLLEEGVEAVVDVVLEVSVGRHLGQDLLDDALVVGEDLVEGVGAEGIAREQIDEFAEGETAQVVRLHDAVKFRVLILEPHDAAAGEYDVETGVEIVALTELAGPVRLLEDLVDEEHATTVAVEFSSEVGDAVALKIEVVHVDIQALTVLYVEMFLGVLQQKGGLADASGALDADHAMGPVDLVHEGAADGGIGVLD